MDSSMNVSCVLIKDGRNLLGVGMIAGLDPTAKTFCNRISVLFKSYNNRVINVADDTITFSAHKQQSASFRIDAKDAAVLRTLLTDDNIELDYYTARSSECDFKIVIAGMGQLGHHDPLTRIS